MKPIFVEATDSQEPEFDLEEMFRRKGEAPLDPAQMKALGEAVKVILLWVTDVNYHHRQFHRLIVRRMIAFCWTLNPEYFEGPSLATLARKLGISRAALSTYSANVSRKFKIRNRAQVQGWNFNKSCKKKEVQNEGG